MSETAERAPDDIAVLPPTPGLGEGPWGAVKRAGAVLALRGQTTLLGADHLHTALAQCREVGLGGRVPVHVIVHRRRYQYGQVLH